MEYYQKDLRQFLNEYKEKNELIDKNIVYNIIIGICLGIKEIHDNNIIHRDLKPENIFLNEDNEIKIGDFGISKQLEVNDGYAYSTIGSNYYMAPEIIKGEKYNNKIDIWSFGCIIYELLTLNICFKDKSLFGFINKITKEKHGNIDLNKYDIKCQELIDLLLKKDYINRPNINEAYNFIKFQIKNINIKININEKDINIQRIKEKLVEQENIIKNNTKEIENLKKKFEETFYKFKNQLKENNNKINNINSTIKKGNDETDIKNEIFNKIILVLKEILDNINNPDKCEDNYYFKKEIMDKINEI